MGLPAADGHRQGPLFCFPRDFVVSCTVVMFVAIRGDNRGDMRGGGIINGFVVCT